MGMFKNLSQTKIIGDAVYPKYGRYFNRIDKIATGMSRKNELRIIINYTVLAVLPSSEPPPTHFVGEEACQYIKVSGSEYAAADWAGFITGLMGVKVEELDSPEVRVAFGNRDSDDWASNEDHRVGPVQPMRGMIGEMYNRMGMTKDEPPHNPSHPFTRTKWVREVPASEVAKGMTAEQIKQFFPAGVA